VLLCWVGVRVAGRDYDPRRRPWYLSGSNGPKNVIFILDSSGSMQTASRMSMLKTAAKKLVDSMTFADYIGIIDFDDSAKTYLVRRCAQPPCLALLPVPLRQLLITFSAAGPHIHGPRDVSVSNQGEILH
jgi:hypothetical protein